MRAVLIRAAWALQILLLSAASAQAQPDAASLAAQLALGQRIYREGVGASGEPVAALGAAQVSLSGKDAGCIACHRRSGYGTSEGRYTVRPITGPALLQEQTVAVHSPRVKALLGTNQRPPYTEALLERAIRGGVDSAGKQLDPLMPRYALSDAEMKALSAYLLSLSAEPSPGVDDREIHFATVIQPGVAAERRRAMLDVMNAFVKDKDANMRSEEQRRQVGNMRMYRAYRKWVLHVWELSGPSETWGAQLEALYRQQPVFALIGGLGTASWRPIHEFSERLEIPSVFPQTDLPALAVSDVYTFYFSRGTALEGEVLAKFLREQARPGRIAQVYRRDSAGAAGAAAVRAAIGPASSVEDRPLDGPAGAAMWRDLCAARPDAVVLWLSARELQAAGAPGAGCSPAIYLSNDASDGKRAELPFAADANVRAISVSDPPPKHDARLLRNRIWLHNKGIPVVDESVQVNTQFAMAVVSDVIGHLADSFSRDYFVERIEHAVGQTPMQSYFPQVSLGPGQRYAAKGASIVSLSEADRKAPPVAAWIVP